MRPCAVAAGVRQTFVLGAADRSPTGAIPFASLYSEIDADVPSSLRLEVGRDKHPSPQVIDALARALRLVIQPLPPEEAERQRARRRRKANKKSQKIDPRTLLAAGFVMLITSLPDTTSPGQVLARYRDRWQVEIGFKRMKTLGGLDELASADPILARTWLLAHLIAAVLTDDLANEIVGFPPCA